MYKITALIYLVYLLAQGVNDGKLSRMTITKQSVVPLVWPYIVTFAEDQATLCETRWANFCQLGLTAGALETVAVPVPIQSKQEEAVWNLASTSSAPLPCQGPHSDMRRLCITSSVYHNKWVTTWNRMHVNWTNVSFTWTTNTNCIQLVYK